MNSLYFKAKNGGGGGDTETEWVRPPDWLPMPTGITAASEIFVGLHAIFEAGQNFCAMIITTSAGQYQVDWGDGTVTLHNSNTKAEHVYDYATYDTAGDTISVRGYKQAFVTVTAVSGNIRAVNFNQNVTTSPAQNRPYASGFLDCILSVPNADNSDFALAFSGGTVRHTRCERFEFKTTGLARSLSNFFNQCFSLQVVILANTSNILSVFNMFIECRSLRRVQLFDTSNVTNFASMFQGCSGLKTVPVFNTSSGQNFTSMFQNCSAIERIPLLDTSNATNMSAMVQGCSGLKLIPNFNTSSVNAGYGNFAVVTNSLSRVLMSFNRSVSFQNSQLSREALVEIFTNLEDRTSLSSQNINITGCWGASNLTTADRDIALNKNWVITG